MDEPRMEGGEPQEPQMGGNEPQIPRQETQQEIFEQRARASGKQAQQAMLATWQGAKTASEKMLIAGGILGIISFFLPWFSASVLGISANISGLEFARHGQMIVWFFPIMMAGTLFLSWLNLHSDASKHILSARWIILIGAAWSWFWVNNLFSSGSSSGVSAGMTFGSYLAALASFLVLIAGIMQIQDYLRLMPSSSEHP